MANDFVQTHAPDLALQPRGQWVTPEPQAGLSGPDNLYSSQLDANGERVPLNYIQEGGVRSFYTPQNTTPGVMPPTAPTTTPVQGLRGRTSQAPLRGLTDPNAPTLDIPIISRSPARQEGPQDILRGRAGLEPPASPPVRQPYNGPRATATIPDNTRVGQDISTALQRRGGTDQQMANQVARAAIDQRAMERAMRPEGSLADMLGGFQIDLSGLQAILGGRNGDLRGRTPLRSAPTPISQLPMVDPHADLPPSQPRVRRVASTLLPDFSTDEGLAAFNARTGMNLGRQMRTQEEQDSLYNRGLTPTRNSRHIPGRAMDYPGRRLGGRTGAEAEQFVREQWEAWGYSTEGVEFRYESGHGTNQGTGRHVHVEW